jgi:hypothetical protein
MREWWAPASGRRFRERESHDAVETPATTSEKLRRREGSAEKHVPASDAIHAGLAWAECVLKRNHAEKLPSTPK